MSRLAPTSTPRVGSSSTTTRGCGCSTLASASFCWLPPDSEAARQPSEPVRMPKSLRPPRCSAARSAPRLQPAAARSAASAISVRFSAQAEVDVQALALAVLAQVGEAVVARRRAGCGCAPRGRRARCARRCAGAGPSRPSNSSVRPAPTRPAKPRISPGAHLEAHVLGPARHARGPRTAQQRRRRRRRRRVLRREQVRQLAARPSGWPSGGASTSAVGLAGDEAAVAHHDHLVGDALDLVELVRDVDDGHAVGLELRASARTGARSRRASASRWARP